MKTAVEWFELELSKLILDGLNNKNYMFCIVPIFDKAKELEKQQTKRMYSEEEVFNLCCEFATFVSRKGPSYKKQREWFEQFKKK